MDKEKELEVYRNFLKATDGIVLHLPEEKREELCDLVFEIYEWTDPENYVTDISILKIILEQLEEKNEYIVIPQKTEFLKILNEITSEAVCRNKKDIYIYWRNVFLKNYSKKDTKDNVMNETWEERTKNRYNCNEDIPF